MMAGYLPMIIRVINYARHHQAAFGKSYRFIVGVILIAMASIALALYLEIEWLLWLAVGVSASLQGVLIYQAYRIPHIKTN